MAVDDDEDDDDDDDDDDGDNDHGDDDKDGDEEEECEHCGCCKRDSAKILAGGRAICLSADNYCDNNYN